MEQFAGKRRFRPHHQSNSRITGTARANACTVPTEGFLICCHWVRPPRSALPGTSRPRRWPWGLRRAAYEKHVCRLVVNAAAPPPQAPSDSVPLLSLGSFPSHATNPRHPSNHLAHHGLFDRGRVGSADTVLVLGAAGGVGAAAVQIAARTGATVIAAASSLEKRELARALGAHHTIDYLATD